jgi:steroid delta-isomerase-like uncharacterized protein
VDRRNRKELAMSEENKALVRRFYDEVTAGDMSVVDELVADDLVEHEEFPGIPSNKEGVKLFFEMFRAAFPDMHMEAREMIAEGDLVSARFVFTGTHQGEFMGVPATGKRVEVEGFDLVRIRDGQATEHWGQMDAMALMQQLGAIPEQTPA